MRLISRLFPGIVLLVLCAAVAPGAIHSLHSQNAAPTSSPASVEQTAVALLPGMQPPAQQQPATPTSPPTATPAPLPTASPVPTLDQTTTVTPTATPTPRMAWQVPTSTPDAGMSAQEQSFRATALARTVRERLDKIESRESAPEPVPLRERFLPQPDDLVTEVRPGVIHIQRFTNDPLHINVLLFDLTRPEVDIQAGLGDGWLSGRTRTSYVAWQYDALAAINADLFAGQGVPQGLMMIDGRVVMPPKHRATFGWTKDHEPFIGYFTNSWTWEAYLVAENGERRWISELNRFCPFDGMCLYNRFARVVPVSDYRNEVKVLVSPSGRVVDMVEGSWLAVEPGMRVFQGIGEGADWLWQNVQISDTLTVEITTTHDLDEFSQIISGGPIILDEGEFVQDCLCRLNDCSEVYFETQAEYEASENWLCEDFSTYWKETHYEWVYMPRVGIGYDKWKQTLIVAVVDGYQLGFSRGALQTEFADLLREFGAYTAMEFDGGGSATMVLEHEIVNQPSDDTGERYVANSLLFFWREENADAVPVEQEACRNPAALCVR